MEAATLCGIVPRFQQDLTDDLLSRDFQQKSMRQSSPLAVERLWRLAAAVHVAELDVLTTAGCSLRYGPIAGQQQAPSLWITRLLAPFCGVNRGMNSSTC